MQCGELCFSTMIDVCNVVNYDSVAVKEHFIYREILIASVKFLN